jgi:hypothetical protein
MVFMISVYLLAKASMKRGGKSSLGSVSRAEMSRASFLSKLYSASCRRVGGALLLILLALSGKEPGKHQEEAEKLISKSKFKYPEWPGGMLHLA